MDTRNLASASYTSSFPMKTSSILDKLPENPHSKGKERVTDSAVVADVDIDIDIREVYFLIMHFLSAGPCQKTFVQFSDELMEHCLLPRRYHVWYSRTGVHSGDQNDDGVSFPLTYENLLHRYPHIANDHLVRLLKQLMLHCPRPSLGMSYGPNAADVPTLLGTGSFSLLCNDKNEVKKQAKLLPSYLRWPHKQIDQVHGLHLRAIGGGFARHHRASSIHAACNAIAKPSTMVQRMQNITRLRGHRNAVYCAIFDRSGRYVITGSDDRLVKIWSMETAFCLASCRGHEGDITDLAVSSNNALVASASNDFVIRVWRLPDGLPISILQGHTGAVTAIAFSPRPGSVYQLLSSSDDGTCRIWDARNSQCKPRIYVPKPVDSGTVTAQQNHQILCCAFNANGTVFVTGSSDTFARVWSACKFSADDLEQPYHEIDLLAGHENDVNYVQFSGCAVTARSATADVLKEDHAVKFKNSWFSHDNIVTCSRDGSAIIWIPRSRRLHGKVGRWTKAYHLKVPPPPLPPQPPRGGPRRRILPTPRGVNMIVWSLDNRFVLAAIMDCRICVWNASDGSLVHSLTGHTESTYVLDVHPFNPRIAMSAGYDGKTIIWDIWEGTPVRVFEIGRSKLVDGKFSSDGTSIVLSDDIGQIYLLNTGQGESHRDAKYDQFFLGDYRPLARDSVGNVLDQESQLVPYRRNLQDPLCDSSLIPYPDPYQSMYQRRRLGVLGMEWRPSSMKFAIGPDFSLGEDYQLMPLPDPEAIIDVPDPLDATLWEVENEAITDDTDSEYDIEDENSSGKEQESLGTSSCSETDSDVESVDHKQKQKDGLRRSKRKNERAEVEFTASGRRIRRRRVEDRSGSSSHNIRGKKTKSGRRASKKSSKAKLSRPQRVAARNALNVFSRIPETFSFGEDEDVLESYSSDSESLSQDSATPVELDWDLLNRLDQGVGKPPIKEPTIVNPVELSEAQASNGNRRKLVLKLSIRDPKKSIPVENTINKCDSRDKFVSSSSVPCTLEDKHNSLVEDGIGLCHPHVTNQKPSQSVNKVTIKCKGLLERTPDRTIPSVVDDVGAPVKLTTVDGIPVEDSCGGHLKLKSYENDDFDIVKDTVVSTNDFSSGVKESPQSVPTRIKIKSSGFLKQEKTPKLKIVNGLKNPAASGDSSLLKAHTASCSGGMDEDVDDVNDSEHSPDSDYPDAETDFARRSRSMEMKASTRDSDKVNPKLKLRKSDKAVGTSKRSDGPSGEWILNGSITGRSRSIRSRQDNFYQDDCGPSNSSQSNFAGRKISWLLLSEHEPGYRYIPQLGDEVVYLIQGHREYVETSGSYERGPWVSMKGRFNAVEICLVEGLDYATAPGSGESCCKLILKFIDPSSNVCGKSFRLTLPELNFSDFLVEKTWYEAAVSRSWTSGEICLVWWRNENGEGGNWWEGRIVSSKPKSGDFPDSPWERYVVQYKSDPEPQSHSPWELHDPESRWEPPHIDFERRNKLLDSLAKLERRKQDYGMEKLEQASQRPDFLNRFPVPLSPDVVKSRLKHNYYRSLEAAKHDVDVMMSNALLYFSKNADVSKKMRRLADYFQRTLSAMF